jgi:hypothetical protein
MPESRLIVFSWPGPAAATHSRNVSGLFFDHPIRNVSKAGRLRLLLPHAECKPLQQRLAVRHVPVKGVFHMMRSLLRLKANDVINCNCSMHLALSLYQTKTILKEPGSWLADGSERPISSGSERHQLANQATIFRQYAVFKYSG